MEARPFRPLSPFAPWNWGLIRHRDHRKMLSVDGEVAIVGGLCISENWAPSSQRGGGWRDTGLLVRGAIVADIDAAFAMMWHRAGEPRPPHPSHPASTDGFPAALVVADRPGVRHVSSLYQWIAERAQHSLEITDAYMVTPPMILHSFERAGRRGVDVRLLLPGCNNHPVAGAAARRNYDALSNAA